MWRNFLTSKLGITYPIIKAPMFGSDTPQFVAEVSNAGGLGTFGAGRMSGEAMTTVIKEIKTKTNKPFAVNIFIPEQKLEGLEKVDKVNEIMDTYRKELGIDSPKLSTPNHDLEEQMSVLLAEEVPVVSFTFGFLEAKWIKLLKQNHTILIGTATNVREAIFLENMGVDAIVAQGSEAGGHRGTFIGNYDDSLIGTMALVPQIVSVVKIPVIAAGGIMDGRGIVASLALGASGVQLGTAFLTCEESGAPSAHKESILQSTEEQSIITRTFSGKPARGIQNRFKQEMEQFSEVIPGYPIQDVLTKDIRDEAARQDRSEFMSLWSGQGTRLSRKLSTKELFMKLVEEAEETLSKLK